MKIEEIDSQIAKLQKQKKELKKEQERKDMEYLRGLRWLANKTANYVEHVDVYGDGKYILVIKDNIDDILKIVNQPQTLIYDKGYGDVYIVNDEKTLHISSYSLESIIELAEQLSIKITLTEEIKTQIHLLNRLQDCSE